MKIITLLLNALKCILYRPFREVYVTFGTTKRPSSLNDIDGSVTVKAVQVAVGFFDQSEENDIAILKFNKAIAYSSHIWPICLPSTTNHKTRLNEGLICHAAGWGRTEDTGNRRVAFQL